MAGRASLNAKNLEALGSARLAALLLQHTEGNAAAQGRCGWRWRSSGGRWRWRRRCASGWLRWSVQAVGWINSGAMCLAG
ncbi:MAG: hypothetical protein NTZ40_04865 [Cyanobacteria bacterium]|nr:hypothetical protein [Cyanobacteriota bacterium]